MSAHERPRVSLAVTDRDKCDHHRFVLVCPPREPLNPMLRPGRVQGLLANWRCRREKDLRTNERKNDELEMRMKDDVPDKEIESGGFN